MRLNHVKLFSLIKIAILFFFLFFYNTSHAQSSYTDSLELQLKTAKDTARITLLINLAQEYRSSQPDKAMPMCNEALAIANHVNDKPKKARALSVLGTLYLFKGQYDKALPNYQQALTINESLNNKKLISVSLNNLGNVYYYQNAFDKALVYYKRSLVIDTELNDKQGVAESLDNIGNIYEAQKKIELALKSHTESLSIREAINDKSGIAFALNNIGNLYLSTKQVQMALAYFQRALEINTQLADTANITLAEVNIGVSYIELHQYDKAKIYLEKGLLKAKKLGLRNIVMEVYINYALLNANQKNYENAYLFYKKYAALKDSIYSEESMNTIHQLEAKYENESKVKEIELLKQQSKVSDLQVAHQKTISISVVIGLILCIVLSLALYNRFRLKRNANAVLEVQKNKLEQALTVIGEKNKEITDSITYAKRIQQATLPSTELIFQTLKQSFILYKPKDVVSGDFYSFAEKNGAVILAAVDCTGHGVPGAFMSMIGHNLLNEIIVERGITKPSVILEELNRSVRKALHQDTNNTRDGMDAVIISFDTKNLQLEYSGANRPLIIMENTGVNPHLKDIKPTKAAIGGHTDINQVFENHSLSLNKGDSLYLFTDGYADQFGGAENKKFMSRQFKELLVSIQHLDMQSQEKVLDNAFENWCGNNEQIDDVLVIGVKI